MLYRKVRPATRAAAVVPLLLLLFANGTANSAAAFSSTLRVSVSSSGGEADANSEPAPAISAGGRFVAFASNATNLVGGDTNGVRDIFVRDVLSGVTERVSVSSQNLESDGESLRPSISADGRYVAFRSIADNLVPGDSNATYDVFVRDRVLRATERVSVGSNGTEANGGSFTPSLSGDGRFVAFVSFATNLVDGDANGHADIFVRDRTLGTTELVSVGQNGAGADGDSILPAISMDGRFVAFVSLASNLAPATSPGTYNVFLRDRQAATTQQINLTPSGTPSQGDTFFFPPSISASGRFVAFTSFAGDLVPGATDPCCPNVFVRDVLMNTTELESVSSNGSQGESGADGAISPDGRFVAFSSQATNLVPGGTTLQQIFLHDRLLGVTVLVSSDNEGGQGDGNSFPPLAISLGGRLVAFASAATNLVAGDNNGDVDVFVKVR